jgi:hypothetical protein
MVGRELFDKVMDVLLNLRESVDETWSLWFRMALGRSDIGLRITHDLSVEQALHNPRDMMDLGRVRLPGDLKSRMGLDAWVYLGSEQRSVAHPTRGATHRYRPWPRLGDMKSSWGYLQ